MNPADYAERFLSMNVFLTTTDGAPAEDPGPVSMYLPDPRRPRVGPGKPMEPGRWQRFRVDRYRLKCSGYADFLVQALRKEAMIGLKVMRIDGSIQTHSVTFPEISYAIAAPFCGKGYPEECQIVLQLWHRYGITKVSVNSLISQGLIGLDCSGFVGGYIERRASPALWRRTKSTMTGYYVGDLMGPSTGYFKSWDDFQPLGPDCLLLGMCDSSGNVKDHDPNDANASGHIVITQPYTLSKAGPQGPVTVFAVESTGPVGSVGLQVSPYKILSMTLDNAKKAIFRVQRGSKLGKAEEYLHFRIVRLR
jgi:hypothetical protein